MKQNTMILEQYCLLCGWRHWRSKWAISWSRATTSATICWRKKQSFARQANVIPLFYPSASGELNTLCLEVRAAEDAAPQARYSFTKDEELELKQSAAYIYKVLKDTDAAAMCGSNPATFGQVLSAAGIVRKHTKQGNVYLVKRVNAVNPIEDA